MKRTNTKKTNKPMPVRMEIPKIKPVNPELTDKAKFQKDGFRKISILNLKTGKEKIISGKPTAIEPASNENSVLRTRVGVVPVMRYPNGLVSLILGYDKTYKGKPTYVLSDFGGKSDVNDKNSWEGAVRELREETAVKERRMNDTVNRTLTDEYVRYNMNTNRVIEVRHDYIRPKSYEGGEEYNAMMYIYYVPITIPMRDRLIKARNDEMFAAREVYTEELDKLLEGGYVYGWQTDKPVKDTLYYSVHKTLSAITVGKLLDVFGPEEIDDLD